MNKHVVHKMKKCVERAVVYLTALVKLILIAMLCFLTIDLIILVGKGLDIGEYSWLAMIAYIVMNIFVIVLLSKFIIETISLLKPRIG